MGWFSKLFGRDKKTEAKSYQVQLLVGDDGFMVAQNFTGGSLYTVYTQAIWTYICASRISQDISNIPAIVQTRDVGSKTWIEDPDHELNALLDRPYGAAAWAPSWNWSQMIAAGTLRQELGGNQFYRIVDAPSRLLALQLYLNELKANEDPTTKTFTTYTPVGSTEEIPAEQVVNVMHASPDSFWRGVSPTVANEQATRVDYAASRRVRYDMETRVAPGVVFKVKGIFTVTDDQYNNIKTKLENTYEGATKQGKSLVVGDDTTVEGAPLHQVDDIPTHAANARDAIISSFDVSPPMVGVLRDAKYTNWAEAKRAQFNLCILPRLNNLYRTINTQAVYPIYPDRNVRIWYDLVQSPLGLAAIAERGETATVYHGLGWPAAQLNEKFDLQMPPFDGWDKANMPAVVAGRVPGEGSGDPAPDDTDGDDE